MRTPVGEREVVITFYTDEDNAEVYTSDYSYMNKLDKLCEANPDDWRCVEVMTCEGDVVGKTYTCPNNFISFRSKSRTGVKQTEEQKEAARQRMLQLHQSKRLDAAG